jgi:mersacidin/lichenicidin family type 2 lantibiotic
MFAVGRDSLLHELNSDPCFITLRKEMPMSQHVDIARAWKDEEYRRSLSDGERAQLPTNPAGLIELTDDDLDSIAGGMMGDGPPYTEPGGYWAACG